MKGKVNFQDFALCLYYRDFLAISSGVVTDSPVKAIIVITFFKIIDLIVISKEAQNQVSVWLKSGSVLE